MEKIIEAAKEVAYTVGDWFDYNIDRIQVVLLVFAFASGLILFMSILKEEAPAFNRAILQGYKMEEVALQSWEDYSDDQYRLVGTDGTVYLVSKDKTILVCDQEETLSK